MGKPGLVYRAALEGVTYSLLSGVNQMKALTGVSDLKQLIVVGGGSHNQLWCQIIADSFGVPVSLPNEVETAALGGKHEHHIDRYHSPPSKEYHHLSTAHNMTTNSKHKLRQNKKKNTNRQPLLVYYWYTISILLLQKEHCKLQLCIMEKTLLPLHPYIALK